MPHPQPNPLYYLIPIVILLPVMYFRIRRMSGVQPLKLPQLWIRPAILVVLTAVVLATTPPAMADAPWLALAGVLGTAAGWFWGRMQAIHVHPEDGTLMTSGGQAATVVFVALIVIRMALNTGLRMEAQDWKIDPILISDASIVFAAFLFAARGVEMFIRARRVMREHVASTPVAPHD